jgi:hypothetical protein|tara:strand:+ start:127 stop:306 length:180 start_codon:yes stop_codon:yes gene_type:complete
VAALAVTEVADPTETLGEAAWDTEKIAQNPSAAERAIPQRLIKMSSNQAVRAFSGNRAK